MVFRDFSFGEDFFLHPPPKAKKNELFWPHTKCNNIRPQPTLG